MRRITVVVTDEEHGLLREAAFDRRLSMSEFVRRAVQSAVRRGEAVVFPSVPVVRVPEAEFEQLKAAKVVPVEPAAPAKGKCPLSVPRGTRCKSCGKVH